MKKLLFGLFLFPLLFSFASILLSNDAEAVAYKLNVKVKNDLNNSNTHNDAPTDSCYNGSPKIRIIDDSGSSDHTWSSRMDCGGTSLKQGLEVDLDRESSNYKVQLIAPTGREYNYIRIYNLDTKKSTYVSKSLLKSTVTVPKGNYEVAFGLKPGAAKTPTPSPKPKPKITAEYILIDDGDLKKESGEKCYVNAMTLKIGGSPKSWGNRTLTCTGSLVTEHDGESIVDLDLPSGSAYMVYGLSYKDSTTSNKYVVKAKTTAQNIKGNGSIRFYIKSKPAQPSPTSAPYSTIINIFVDGNKNGIKDSGENCPANTTAKVKIGSGNETAVTCTKTFKTHVSSRNVSLTSINNNYVSTGLTKIDDDGRKTLTNGAKSTGVTGTNATVNFGVKKSDSANPTDKCDTNAECKRKTDGKKPVCYKAVSKTESKCVECTENNTAKCSSTEKCVNNECKPKTDGGNGGGGGNACNRNEYTFAVNPDSKKVDKPGDSAKYEVKIKNNDTNCGASNFTLSSTVLDANENWKATLGSKEFNLKSGEEKTVNLTVTSPDGAKKGAEKNVNVKAKKGTQAPRAKQVKYSINGTDNPTPTDEPSPTDDPNPNEGETTLKLTMGIAGIGTSPLIVNGNPEPVNKDRSIHIKIIQAGDNSKVIFDKSVKFSFVNRKFQGTIQVNDTDILPNAAYNIYASGPGFTNTQYPISVKINKSGTNILDNVNFYIIGGNIDNSADSENKRNLIDYEKLIACVVNTGSKKQICDQNENYIKHSDIDDSGDVNIDDLNLFLKIFSEQRGVVIPD